MWISLIQKYQKRLQKGKKKLENELKRGKLGPRKMWISRIQKCQKRLQKCKKTWKMSQKVPKTGPT